MILTKYYDLDNSSILLQVCLENLKTYLTKQGYPKPIVEIICDMTFINANPSYYLYYPYLYNSSYNYHNDSILKKLSIAGFLYYKSIIYIDDVFDNKEGKDTFNKFTISNICQEEAIKLLSDLFNIDSNFWKIWNKRKFEYFKAYELDKVSHNIQSYRDYEILADYKSSFGKIAIDALYILTEERNKSDYTKILESHKYFYVAFQILDDILDYEEDYYNSQFNISKFELERSIKNLNDYNIKAQKKLLYSKNVAIELYEKAQLYLNKSLDLCKDLNAPKWKNELQILYNTALTHKLNVYGFVKYSFIINNLEKKTKEENTIKKAISTAKNYILNTQESNGCWEDFLNDAGISDIWATAFVTYSLSKDNILISEFQKSKGFLLSNTNSDYVWGYNTDWIPDADSTSFAILALNSLGHVFKEEELKGWYSYQNDDGGFSTYNNEQELSASLNSKDITNVTGWLNSHFCVSSIAYLVFSELKINNKYSKKLREYLIYNLKTESYQPYWWTSSIYSISYLIIASSLSHDNEILLLCNRILNKYLKNIQFPIKNEFYAGLLLNAVCYSNNELIISKSILSKLVLGLIESQKKDGSWEGNYSLRMPSPHIINPNIEVKFWDENNRGTNIHVKDFHRLFTTVSCLSALTKYDSIK